jgi:uncharacterized protein (TIGR03435 family)
MKVATKLNFSGRFFVNKRCAVLACAAIVCGLAGGTPSRAQGQQDVPSMSAGASAAARDAGAARMASGSSSLPMTGGAATFEYEVASVRLSKMPSGNGGFRFGMRYTDDGVSIENFPLMLLVQQAYGVGKDRISGAPDWLNSDRYDIEAKVDPARVDELKKLSPDELKAARQQMLQKLLEDRFKLTLHRETKELPIYNLVVAKGGPKIQESKPDETTNKGDKTGDVTSGGKKAATSPGGPLVVGGGGNAAGSKSASIAVGGGNSVSFGGRGGNRSMSGKGITMQGLTATLANATGRPVMDKTGLTGKYDYKLEYAPDDNSVEADPTGPSIFTAVQEQLGLKLESAKGPVEIFVIDHVEQPSGN